MPSSATDPHTGAALLRLPWLHQPPVEQERRPLSLGPWQKGGALQVLRKSGGGGCKKHHYNLAIWCQDASFWQLGQKGQRDIWKSLWLFISTSLYSLRMWVPIHFIHMAEISSRNDDSSRLQKFTNLVPSRKKKVSFLFQLPILSFSELMGSKSKGNVILLCNFHCVGLARKKNRWKKGGKKKEMHYCHSAEGRGAQGGGGGVGKNRREVIEWEKAYLKSYSYVNIQTYNQVQNNFIFITLNKCTNKF